MSSASTASSLASAIESWRPMAFGPGAPKHIKDPLCEPLWAGWRALVDVVDRAVGMRDQDGDPLEGFDELRAAIAESSRASELVLDGYLLPGPIRDTLGAEATPGMDATPSAGQISRQFFFGGMNRRKEERRIEAERDVDLSPDAPTAFVAVDLLWIDGQSLIDVPLLERKRLLESVLVEYTLVRRTVAVRPPVEAWFGQWRALGFREYGVKAANSRYRPGTISNHWATDFIPRR